MTIHQPDQPTQAPQCSMTYADAGVDINAGNSLVERIKPLAKATARAGCMGAVGGFGALFDVKAAGYTDPVLVSGTDGVGTKLKLAEMMDKHDTIGIDLVAMCVNDLLAQGAEPLFFLDYFACGKLDIATAEAVVAGIAQGCSESGCALVGGETAEMPGMYAEGTYDLAGFCVGAVERTQLLPRMESMQAGDVLIGLPSSGFHSNGYSLVRKLLERSGLALDAAPPFAHEAATLGEALLAPTRLYVKPVIAAIKAHAASIHGFCHITGGGLTENLPRVFPEHVAASVARDSWQMPAIFSWAQQVGNISDAEMLRTFNCGIGGVLIVAASAQEAVCATLRAEGEAPVVIGTLVDRSTEAVLYR